MISSKHRVIFVHTPKCAGTTIINYFKSKWDDLENKHLTMDEIVDLLEDDLSEYFKFTIIRNPWERMASLYSYLQSPNSRRVFKELNEKYDTNTFEKFILKLPVLKEEYNPKTTFMSILEYIGDYEYDMVIDITELDSRLSEIFPKFGMEFRKNPIKSNKSTNTNKNMRMYTTEMVKIVSDVYSDDVKRFNFKFND